MNTDEIIKDPSWSDIAKNIFFILLVVGVAYFVTVYIGFDNLKDKVLNAGIFAPFILIFLKATTIVVAPLGGTIIYPISGALFGLWKGVAITFIGDAIGSSIAFWISRRFGKSVLRYFTASAQMPMVEKVVERLGDRKNFVKTRIFFSGFMDLFAYAAGLTKINFWFFISVHMAVHSALITLYVAFGDLLVSGSYGIVLLVGVAGGLLAVLGAWLFHLDLVKGN